MEYVALVGFIIAKALKGIMHGHTYARQGYHSRAHRFFTDRYTVFGRSFKLFGIHWTDWLFSIILGIMCLAAGADLIQTFGAALVAMVPFQWPINLSVGRELFEVSSSPKTWSMLGIEWPRPFSGPNLYRVGLPVGLVFMFYKLILEIV